MEEQTTRTLNEVRKEQGIGIRRLSKGAPVAPRTIYGIERQTSTPQPDTIRRISQFLGVDPMEVTEFRAALEAEGLDALPEKEPADFLLASPAREDKPRYAEEREEARSELARLMRVLGLWETVEVYREVWGEDPPQP